MSGAGDACNSSGPGVSGSTSETLATRQNDYMEELAAMRGGKPEDWTLLLQTDALDAELYVALPTQTSPQAAWTR